MYRSSSAIRTLSRSRPLHAQAQRYYATPAAVPPAASTSTPPPPANSAEKGEKLKAPETKDYGGKVNRLIAEISKLTLVEAGWLVEGLKTKLNITAIAPVATGPVAKPKEKTIFAVKLESIAADAKAKVIKAVKGVRADMNLMQAKTFVESLPQVLKDNVTKEDAEKMKAALEEVGAKVTLDKSIASL
ncbi:ClpS-like protein [Atractiella rhizophila]|nr:ClpS-like protein [Atractiella rhizophila]